VSVIGVTGQSAMTNRESAISIPTVRADACSRPLSSKPYRKRYLTRAN